jgi:hypothetical protein
MSVGTPLSQKLSSTKSAAWTEWAGFCRRHMPANRLPHAERVVGLLQQFLGGCDFSQLSGQPFLARIRERFNIVRAEGAPTGHGSVKVEKASDDWFGYDAVVALGNATRFRRHMVEAHELGHLFLASVLETMIGSKDSRPQDLDAERFCWEFALAALCPASERRRWDLAYVSSLVPGSAVESAHRDLGMRLSFLHLRALAQRSHISIRLAVSALDRHQLLDEAECGIAILRRMPNLATGQDLALRVMIRARPSWGFLVKNQRASKQGFSRAQDVFESAKSQETITQEEHLCLRFATDQARPRWALRIVSVPCAYTAVDVQTEGRYLVAIWPWQKPRG